jgi:hypothetical protein
MLTLARGAITGVGKRPSATSALPARQFVRPAARIEAERVRAYAEVCGFAAPGGRWSGAVPLTYPHVLGFPLAARIMAERAFPLPLTGLVHTGIRISARHGGLRVDDHPEVMVYAAELRPHRRGTEVVMVTSAQLDGEVVWEDHSTYLARHADASAPSERADSSAAPDPSVLPADLGRRHARVSGDYNPIHLFPLTAKPFGFSRAIAHGMWTIARCVAAAYPDAAGLSARFRRPIPLPATVHFAAQGPHFAVRGAAGIHLTGNVT